MTTALAPDSNAFPLRGRGRSSRYRPATLAMHSHPGRKPARLLPLLLIVGGALLVTLQSYVLASSPPDIALGLLILVAAALTAPGIIASASAWLPVGACMLLLLIVNVFGYLGHIGLALHGRGVTTILALLLSGLSLLIGFGWRWQRRPGAAVTVLCVIIAVGISAMAAPRLAGLLQGAGKNLLGGLGFHLGFLLLGLLAWRNGGSPTRKSMALVTVLLLLVAAANDQRALLVVSALVPAALLVARNDTSRISHLLFPLLAWLISGAVVVFLAAYRRIAGFSELDAWFYATTGRVLTSGREEIWEQVLAAIGRSVWIGHGPQVVAADFTGAPLSTHHAFLLIALQTGVVGLACTLLLFATILFRGVLSPDRQRCALLAVYLCVVIIHNSSETVLFNNFFPIVSVTWVTLGFLLAHALDARDDAGAGAGASGRPPIRSALSRPHRPTTAMSGSAWPSPIAPSTRAARPPAGSRAAFRRDRD